jgi:hypothetical protein
MLASSGDSGPPCGVPSALLTWHPSGRMTPSRRNCPMSRSIRLSLTTRLTCAMRMSWFTWSKNLVMSMSTTHSLPSRACCCAAPMAPCALRPGRNPWLASLKCGSNSGPITWSSSCCTKRSSTLKPRDEVASRRLPRRGERREAARSKCSMAGCRHWVWGFLCVARRWV